MDFGTIEIIFKRKTKLKRCTSAKIIANTKHNRAAPSMELPPARSGFHCDWADMPVA